MRKRNRGRGDGVYARRMRERREKKETKGAQRPGRPGPARAAEESRRRGVIGTDGEGGRHVQYLCIRERRGREEGQGGRRREAREGSRGGCIWVGKARAGR